MFLPSVIDGARVRHWQSGERGMRPMLSDWRSQRLHAFYALLCRDAFEEITAAYSFNWNKLIGKRAERSGHSTRWGLNRHAITRAILFQTIK
jgi:hypothetical protein